MPPQMRLVGFLVYRCGAGTDTFRTVGDAGPYRICKFK